jgi:hypothetical protein
MSKSESLSNFSRGLTYVSAASYFLVGLTMFLAPTWTAADFAWNVSPFVAMTIGAWCIGNAVMAYESARVWRWAIAHPALVYLWAFAITDAVVFALFWDKVVLSSPVALAYAFTLFIAVLTALVGIVEAITLRPSVTSVGAPIEGWVRAGMVFFMIVVGTLALGGLLAQQGGLSTEAVVFPEKLTLFTVRAFAVFFGSLVIAGIPLIRSKGIAPLYFTARAALLLIIPILIAAFVNLDKFDFAARPLGLGYFAAYIGTLIFTLIVLQRYRGSSPLSVST